MSDPDAPWTKRPPHLQRWRDPRSGKEKLYFRPPGGRKIALHAPWGTQALADEVARHAAALPPPRAAPEAGTLVAAIREYRGDSARKIPASADFLALKPRTQIDYDRWLDQFERAFDGVLLSDIDAGFVLALRDKWALKGYRTANLALQILKNVCKAPRIRGEIAGNPFELIDKVPRPHDLGQANPRWLDDEFEAALEHALQSGRAGLGRALALARWGGFRRGSVCALPRRARIWRDSDAGRERRLYWLTEKRLVLCDRREDPRLTALLERTENAKPRLAPNVSPLTIAYNSFGESWKPRAIEHALTRLLEPLEEAGKVRAGLTWHGLRHARGVELAAAGASDAEIMSQLDHASPRQAVEYRKQAERLALADAAQEKVNARVVRLAAARRRQSESS